MSRIESRLLDPAFGYFHPLFYNHPYALRCELSTGDGADARLQTAQCRAEAIAAILFADRDGQPDAIFSDVVLNPSGALRYRADRVHVRPLIDRYRHTKIRQLATDPFYAEDDDPPITARFLCYRDEDRFDVPTLIRMNFDVSHAEIDMVSFAHECIFSIYDARGCDIVFADHHALRRLYPLLEPYFLDYDRPEMARRCRSN